MYTKEILERITAIILASKCSTYVITGYTCLNTRLVLNFHDCKQVYDFKQFSDELVETQFFTKNYEGDEEFTELKAFTSLHEKEVAESK